jgi:hypothetical protein
VKEDSEEQGNQKDKQTKLKVYIIIGLLILSGFVGAITILFIYNPHDSKFTVAFNGKIKDGITAITYLDENHSIINEKFKTFFARDLAKIADNSLFVEGITIVDDYWFWIINAAGIRVDGKGWYVLESLKSDIEGLWYVERVTYSDLQKVI